MTLGMASEVATSERLPKGYTLVESEFGGFYFEVHGEGSEDFRTRRKAAMAAREDARRREAVLKACRSR